MSKLIESSEYMYEQYRSLVNSHAAMERAAENITKHNVQLRVFLLRLIDPDDLGHAVTDEVRKLAQGLLTMERDDAAPGA